MPFPLIAVVMFAVNIKEAVMSIEKLHTEENMRPAPRKITRPCEHGLIGAIGDMESQLGSIEAYNMMVDYANRLKHKIDNGNGKKQMAMFATSTGAVS